jgi:hypothetical protein
MGFAPQFVDMNGDGLEDILSGSYAGDAPQPEEQEGHLVPVLDENGDPASEIFVYYRQSDGSFEDRVAIGMSHTHSAASPVDWDGDGDFDLITASRSSSASPEQAGAINLYENVGTPKEPAFSPHQILIGRVQGHFITSAEAWDWDQDGLLDLVAGTEYGKILWFPNTGTDGSHAFGEPVVLTPEEEEDGSGGIGSTRLAVYITDWDGDGIQDVIGGDFSYVDRTDEEILEGATPSEAEAYHEAKEKLEELGVKTDALYEDVDFRTMSEDEREEFNRKYDEVSAPYSEYQTLIRENYEETSYHGFVWFFKGERR